MNRANNVQNSPATPPEKDVRAITPTQAAMPYCACGRAMRVLSVYNVLMSATDGSRAGLQMRATCPYGHEKVVDVPPHITGEEILAAVKAVDVGQPALREARSHIERVNSAMERVAESIEARGFAHDVSMLEPPEAQLRIGAYAALHGGTAEEKAVAVMALVECDRHLCETSDCYPQFWDMKWEHMPLDAALELLCCWRVIALDKGMTIAEYLHRMHREQMIPDLLYAMMRATAADLWPDLAKDHEMTMRRYNRPASTALRATEDT